MRQFLWFFMVFFYLLDRIFSKCFSQSIHSSSRSFLFQPSFHFSLVVFLSTCGILTLIFCFFIWFFRNDFPNSLVVRSRSSFLFSQWNFFELYLKTCPAMFFNSLYLLITFSFYISHDFHVWLLTYFAHCFNWMHLKFCHALSNTIWWILSKSKETE